MNMPLVKSEPVTATPIAVAASATVLPLGAETPAADEPDRDRAG